jgi:hypothetical protein
MLSVSRGVLKTAWLLGQIDAEDYRKAASMANFQAVGAGVRAADQVG